MNEWNQELRCPLEYGLNIFAGKWKPRIMCMLAKKHILRYGELKRSLETITDAALSDALASLQDLNIIKRTQYNIIPPVVEYQLTSKGESVIPLLRLICLWSDSYVDGKAQSSQCLNDDIDYNYQDIQADLEQLIQDKKQQTKKE